MSRRSAVLLLVCALAVAAPAAPPPPNWEPIGPAPIVAMDAWGEKNVAMSGRIDAIALAPGAVYIGADMGGVWRRSGNRWTPLTDQEASPNIGAVAVDPAAPATIYAATGAADGLQTCDTHHEYAAGILKSVDAGRTWRLLAQGIFKGVTIRRLIVDPADGRHVLAATARGLFVSRDGGATWGITRLADRRAIISCIADIAMSPGPGHRLYVAAADLSVGVLASTGADTFEALPSKLSLPATAATANLANVSLGVASSPAGDVLVASVAAYDRGEGCRWAGLRSADGGRTWTNLGLPPQLEGRDAKFCAIGQTNAVAIDPRNPKISVFGGGYLFVHNVEWAARRPADGFREIHKHAVGHSDIHALAFDGNGHLFAGTDGGLWSMDDPTDLKRGADLNEGGLQITEFERGLAIAHDGSTMLAGSQDNGTALYDGHSTWRGVAPTADGGRNAIDQSDEWTLFTQDRAAGGIVRSAGHHLDQWQEAWPEPRDPQRVDGGFPIASSSPSRLHGTHLYTGSDLLFRSNDHGVRWSPLPRSCPRGPNRCHGVVRLTTIETSPAQTDHVLTGWSDGTIGISTDGGDTWRFVRTPVAPRAVGSLAIDPRAPWTIAVTSGDRDRVVVASHLDTANPSFHDVSTGLPLPVTANAAAFSPAGLIVGTDFGVYATRLDGAPSWSRFGQGLPVTRVTDLRWRSSGELVALTYGRGAWAIRP